jgi:hypothetical protein
LGALGKGAGITWYDVLGVLPGASAEQVERQLDAKAALLRPELLSGAPSPVVLAASRAAEILGTARRVLADPASRARYDESAGVRRGGGSLARREALPSEPGLDWDPGFIAGSAGAELLDGVLALSDWLAPHPRRARRVVVPDVRGLFFSVCLEITGKLGLRVTMVRLTERPMPVDGLVVSQSPGPVGQARRGSELTVRVWHPAARPATGTPGR